MKNLYKELWFQVMIAMVLGLVIGLILSPSGLGLLPETETDRVAPWIALPGNLFLAKIKMVVIPLVLSSIVLGITSSFVAFALPVHCLGIGKYVSHQVS